MVKLRHLFRQKQILSNPQHHGTILPTLGSLTELCQVIFSVGDFFIHTTLPGYIDFI
jgi:hypothetical protein